MKTTDKRIYTEKLPSGPSFDMLLVEGGSFQMGGTDEEAYDFEKPVHEGRSPYLLPGQVPGHPGLVGSHHGE